MKNLNKRMKKFLFHVHTKKSFDSNIKIEKLLGYVIKHKIDYFSVTDHNNFEACKIIEKMLNEKRYRNKTELIKGEEIKTEYGDIIPLFLKREIKTRKFMEVVKEAKKQKALLIIPHPFRQHKNINYLIKYADGIEVYNSSSAEYINKKAFRLSIENPQLLKIVGVDAHSVRELGNALNEIKLGKKIIIKPLMYRGSGCIIAGLIQYKNIVLNIIKRLLIKRNN